jgi:putative aldouronate transport system permease protein
MTGRLLKKRKGMTMKAKKPLLRNMPLHLMILPSLLIVLIYSYGPMFGVLMAFQDYRVTRGIFQSDWVGLDHFRTLLDFPDTKQIIWNTVFIAGMKIVANLIVPIVFALLLNEVRKNAFKRSVQTLVYLPHFLSWVILGGILIDILSPSTGIVNQGLRLLGLDPVYFLGSNDWFPFVIVVSDVWKEFGYGTIVYLAALSAINPALYEAAIVDGANRWKQTLYITLPGIVPVIILLTTLSLGNILNAGFDQIFNLYSPAVYQSGDIIDTLVYRMGLGQAQYGFATAIGLLKSLISFGLIAISYMLAYRFAGYRIF